VYGEIKRDAKDAILQLIEKEREGELIDGTVVKNILNIFIEVGMGPMECYERDFEEHLLTATSDYYKRKAAEWITEDSCPDYMLVRRPHHLLLLAGGSSYRPRLQHARGAARCLMSAPHSPASVLDASNVCIAQLRRNGCRSSSVLCSACALARLVGRLSAANHAAAAAFPAGAAAGEGPPALATGEHCWSSRKWAASKWALSRPPRTWRPCKLGRRKHAVLLVHLQDARHSRLASSGSLCEPRLRSIPASRTPAIQGRAHS
jgi:hypothetical protein